MCGKPHLDMVGYPIWILNAEDQVRVIIGCHFCWNRVQVAPPQIVQREGLS